jgi:hypothetical protein
MSNPYFMSGSQIATLRANPEWQRLQAERAKQRDEQQLITGVRQTLRNAQISSEIRHMGARIMHFCQQLEPFIGVELSQGQQTALVNLYSRFSAEISVIEAAASHIEGAGRVLGSMADVLRTPLEEGILAYRSNSANQYRDPAHIKLSLLNGYRSERYGNSCDLKGLSPASTNDAQFLHVHIEAYGYNKQPLSREGCEALLELTNSRVIDTSLDERQEGFGRRCTLEEFMGFLERNSTQCCVPSDDRGPLGLYVLDTDPRNVPQVASDLLANDPRFDPLSERDGWVDVIALATTARERLRDPYTSWYLAREYAHAENGALLREVALVPSDPSDVGPGDYVRDTAGELHEIASNTAFRQLHPSSWQITSTSGHQIDPKEIDLYLKAETLSSRNSSRSRLSRGNSLRLERSLSPTSATQVAPGDFIRDRDGVLREIRSNTAQGERFPRSWTITTTDNHTFGMFDVSAYLKQEQITEESIQANKPPSLYRWLTLTACETACASGISTLWCQVRIGRQGNTAREKHLAVGWEATGLTYTHNGVEFEILRLDPLAIVAGTSNRELCQLLQLEEMDRPEYVRVRELAQSAWSTKPGDLSPEHFMQTLGSEFPNCEITPSVDQLGRLEVTITPQSGDPIFFCQGLAGHDLWRVQRDPCYSLSLYNPLASLQQTIDRDHEGLCSRAAERVR